jgi:hypothetical protein
MDFQLTTRVFKFLSLGGKNAEVDPVATPALQDLFMAHRESFNWFCASPETMADRTEWHKKAIKFWDDQVTSGTGREGEIVKGGVGM